MVLNVFDLSLFDGWEMFLFDTCQLNVEIAAAKVTLKKIEIVSLYTDRRKIQITNKLLSTQIIFMSNSIKS